MAIFNLINADGDALDSCNAASSDEAYNIFADEWDMNNDNDPLEIEEG